MHLNEAEYSEPESQRKNQMIDSSAPKNAQLLANYTRTFDVRPSMNLRTVDVEFGKCCSSLVIGYVLYLAHNTFVSATLHSTEKSSE